MLKKITVVLIPVVLILLSGCSGGAYSDVREVVTQQTAATEDLISALKNAQNAKDVAKAYKAYNDVMEKIFPRYKEFAQKYPDMEKEMPADLAAAVDKLEKAGNKLGELSMKASEYMNDPEVAKELQRTMNLMSTMM
jgi:Tfp pilus assembly protein PilP